MYIHFTSYITASSAQSGNGSILQKENRMVNSEGTIPLICTELFFEMQISKSSSRNRKNTIGHAERKYDKRIDPLG